MSPLTITIKENLRLKNVPPELMELLVEKLQFINPKWLEPLADTAKFFLGHEHHFDIVHQIVGQYRFRDSDELSWLKKVNHGGSTGFIRRLRLQGNRDNGDNYTAHLNEATVADPKGCHAAHSTY